MFEPWLLENSKIVSIWYVSLWISFLVWYFLTGFKSRTTWIGVPWKFFHLKSRPISEHAGLPNIAETLTNGLDGAFSVNSLNFWRLLMIYYYWYSYVTLYTLLVHSKSPKMSEINSQYSWNVLSNSDSVSWYYEN